MITTNLRIVALAGSVGLLLFIVEVRRRRLKEEYTVLWILTAVVFILLAAWTNLLRELTHAIGAFSEASTLYFFGLIFVILLLLHFSLRVSSLERKLLSLIQELALLSAQRKKIEEQVAARREAEEMLLRALANGKLKEPDQPQEAEEQEQEKGDPPDS